jgi:hypothetical protein
VEIAKQWVAHGAQRLHVVDLDGAFSGQPANLDIVFRIKDTVNVVVQMGGGLRDPEIVRKVLDRGIGRAIVGTAILKYPQWIKSTLAEFPGRLMASLDAVNGEVMIEGWQAESGHSLADAIKAIDAWLALRGTEPGPLFHAINRWEQINNNGLTPEAIRKILIRRALAAEIDPVTPHDLRRTYATNLIAASVPLPTVQKLMGHASVTTTANYDRAGEDAKIAAANTIFIPYQETK